MGVGFADGLGRRPRRDEPASDGIGVPPPTVDGERDFCVRSMCDCFARSDFSWTRANAFAFSAIAFCFSGEALDFLRISGDFDGEVLADCSTFLNSSYSIVPEPSASNESKRLSTWNLGTSKPSSGIAWWNSLRDTVPSPSVSQSLKRLITFACCFLSASRSTRIVASAAAPSWPARSECPLVPKT